MKLTLPRLFQVVALTILFISCSTEDDGIYFENDLASKVHHTELELNILKLVNDHRSSIGVSVLTKLDLISSVASTHTNYMAEIKEVNHDNFPDRQGKLVKNAQAKFVGENVAYGFRTAESVVKAWVNSKEHKNILESENFTHFGVATKSDDEGRLYFTQMFIKK